MSEAYDRLEKGIREYCETKGGIDKAMRKLGINRGAFQAATSLKRIPSHYFLRIMATEKGWRKFFSLEDIHEYIKENDIKRNESDIEKIFS